ncbi:MAG TPA: hypothetical protein VF472_24800 [Burkholderiaceae bacterium]
MTTASVLQTTLGHVPADLLAYFGELTSDTFIRSGANDKGELLSASAAAALTQLLAEAHPLMGMLGALVLDETDTSSYHVYLAAPPLQGCILYLSHDGETRIVYDTPQRFLAAVIEANTADLEELHPPCPPTVADQTGLTKFIDANLDHDDADMILTVAIGCLELKDTSLMRRLATHADFFVAEALGDAIEKRPAPELLALAELCASHKHAQAANAGRRACQTIRRL